MEVTMWKALTPIQRTVLSVAAATVGIGVIYTTAGFSGNVACKMMSHPMTSKANIGMCTTLMNGVQVKKLEVIDRRGSVCEIELDPSKYHLTYNIGQIIMFYAVCEYPREMSMTTSANGRDDVPEHWNF
jgi:hypothetical protein